MPNLTAGPKRRLKPIRFTWENAGRRAVVGHGQVHYDTRFDPSAQQWISVFPGDTWQCLEITFGGYKFWFS